jgi:hypothetical protein
MLLPPQNTNSESIFNMLMNEILNYEKLYKLNLEYVPRYCGECELYGQSFNSSPENIVTGEQIVN